MTDPKFDFLSPVAREILFFLHIFTVVDFLIMSRSQEINFN